MRSICKTEQDYFIWVDLVKGIGILIVVLFHIFLNTSFSIYADSMQLALFFFISGFLFNNQPIKQLLEKRFFSLIVPYLFFSFISFLYYYLIESRFRNISLNILEGIKGICLGDYFTLVIFNAPLWFIPCLFTLTLLFSLLDKIHYTVSYITSLIFIFIYLIFDIPSLYFALDKTLKYFCFFVIGNFIRKKEFHIDLNKWLSLLLVMIAFIIHVIILTYLKFDFCWFVSGFLGIFYICLLCVTIENVKGIQKLLVPIGKNSLIILCIHGPIYRIIVYLLAGILNVDILVVRQNILYSILVLLITISITLCFSWVINNYFPFFIGKKYGRRKENEKN